MTTHLVITIDSLLPVPLSMAETVRIPLAGTFTNTGQTRHAKRYISDSRDSPSISKVTSIWG